MDKQELNRMIGKKTTAPSSVSCGVTWVEVTLNDEGDYNNSIRILSGLADFTETGIGSGTDMVYKITTHNNKDCKIHGTAENWD